MAVSHANRFVCFTLVCLLALVLGTVWWERRRTSSPAHRWGKQGAVQSPLQPENRLLQLPPPDAPVAVLPQKGDMNTFNDVDCRQLQQKYGARYISVGYIDEQLTNGLHGLRQLLTLASSLHVNGFRFCHCDVRGTFFMHSATTLSAGGNCVC
jgi:hypothetical protein